jgi:hypothetical protein
VLDVIEAVEDAETRGWMYVAIVDDDTCDTCLDNENQLVYTDSELEDEFPDMRRVGPDEIYPNVHMTLWGKDGTCRCRLFRYGEGKGDEPDLPRGPVSDEEFDDWLTGLLAAGSIAANIYDLIMKRRKEKKKK